MTESLLHLLALLDGLWVGPAALLLAVALLEAERGWVRARRRRGFRSSPLAGMLDALAILSGLVAAAGLVRRFALPAIASADPRVFAPLLWAAGLLLILSVGLSLIRRYGPAPQPMPEPQKPSHQV